MDVAAAPAAEHDTGADGMAQRIMLGALFLEILVLVVTGAALFFVYRPSSSQAWAGVDTPNGTMVTALRAIHRSASSLSIFTAVGTLVVFLLSNGRKLTWAIGAALVAALVAATFTGYLLPWDQLALWAVTVGDDLSGYRPMFDDRVRFVLMGGTEIGPDTILRWLGVHTLVLTPMALLLVMVLWRQRRRQPID